MLASLMGMNLPSCPFGSPSLVQPVPGEPPHAHASIPILSPHYVHTREGPTYPCSVDCPHEQVNSTWSPSLLPSFPIFSLSYSLNKGRLFCYHMLGTLWGVGIEWRKKQMGSSLMEPIFSRWESRVW